MSVEATEEGVQYEVIDHNIVPDQYVTLIVDIWKGSRTDPATRITRYIGVWRADALETEERGAFNPEFGDMNISRYRAQRDIKPEPMVWEQVEVVKETDRDAEQYREQQENLLDSTRYSYGAGTTRRTLYQAFIEAIDKLAVDDTDEEAWAAVSAYRNYEATSREK